MIKIEKFLDYLLNRGFELSKLVSIVAGIMIMTMAFVITIDITARKFLNWTLEGADEFAGYTLAITGALALTHALFHKRHIRIDLIVRIFNKWPTISSVFDIVALIALAVFIFPLSILAVNVFLMSWQFGSRANTIAEIPLIYPQSLWMIGFVIFSFVIFLMLLRTLIAFFKNEHAVVKNLIGIKSEKEEIEDEKEFKSSNKKQDNNLNYEK